MKRLYRNDLILLCLVLLVCAVFPFALHSRNDEGTRIAIISHDGHTVSKTDLDNEGYFEVNGVTIAVKNGAARVTSSTCPDGLCMQMGSAEKVGESIICVPNMVSVKIVGSENEEEIIVAG